MNIASPGAPRALAAAALALALGGCATIENPNPRDPWEGFNRPAHNFNEGVDRVVLRPVATLYREKVPPLVRTGVSNFFGNMADVWSAVNSLLQFRLQDAGDSIARVNINTLVGIGGIFDVASNFNIERHREDFGQTLGRWGAGPGPYFVLPVLGPSTVRDTFGRLFDFVGTDPVWYIQQIPLRNSLVGLRLVDTRASLLPAEKVLEAAALDRYQFLRDAFLQLRRNLVYDGNPPRLLDPDDEDDPPPRPPVAPGADQPAPGSAR